MTRYDPTLIVTRVVVERGAQTVYDELFHEGVNVVRGENSSGKSTVLNFIFYGLGGDLSDWSAVARLCSCVIIEVQINGILVTLSRDISDAAQQPMEIFGGSYDDSRKAPRSAWHKYGYRSVSGRESFSQALFRLLNIPEVTSDISGNITMNQMLRLLYADQLSPIEQIFRFQPFDQANLRDTVGRLLCGAYDSELYDNDQRIKLLDKEYGEVSGQLKSLFAVLGRIEHGLTFEWIEAQSKSLESERISIQLDIEKAEKAIYASESGDSFTLVAQDKAYKRVQELQAQLGALRKDHDGVALAIADSNAFIASLKSKIDALRDSSRVVQYIGEVRFQSCPACYAPLDEEQTGHACHLCKTPFDSEQTQARISGLIIDSGLQVKQSEQLQVRREERVTSLREEIRALEKEWQEASERLAALQRLPSSEGKERLRALQRRAGYLERQIEDVQKQAKIVESIRELTDRKDQLNDEIVKLKSRNDIIRAQQTERLNVAYNRISEEVKKLLHSDLRRQDIFEDPRKFSFSFWDNKMSVDDESYFSASSRAILKSCFYLGFLAAAGKTPFFRHPRFCMIDTHENMGVEAIRSQNFQLQILKISKETKVTHQIIYATAMIEPQLEDEAYTVGAFSSGDEKTIKIMT